MPPVYLTGGADTHIDMFGEDKNSKHRNKNLFYYIKNILKREEKDRDF